MNLTNEEIERYDRQLKMWGVDGQSSIQKSVIYVVGAKNIGAEVCKNALLSGSTVFLSDDTMAVEGKLHWFYRYEQGNTIAQCSYEGLNVLNEFATLEIVTPGSFNFNRVSFCVYTESDVQTALSLSKACRETGAHFIWCFCNENEGLVFLDAHIHEYSTKQIESRGSRRMKYVPLDTTVVDRIQELLSNDIEIFSQLNTSQMCFLTGTMIGAYASQEILKTLTHIEQPIYNTFHLDNENRPVGRVQFIGEEFSHEYVNAEEEEEVPRTMHVSL
ncbi:hypothetical protein PCE1_003376 [Barthelona sp. PCE]